MEKKILAAMLSCAGESLQDEEKKLFAEYNPLGITLFDRNIKNKKQLKKLVTEIKETIGREDVLIAVDQEGGRVSRLEKLCKDKYASAESLGKYPVQYSRYQAALIAKQLKELGINVNYAPVVDKKTIPQSLVLATRCFSDNENVIATYAAEMADEYISCGICPCIKHLPGHFSGQEDPHLTTVVISLTEEKLKEQTEYLKKLNQYPLAMTSHVILSELDAANPASQSPKVVAELIRKHIGFDGFLISDALDMHALPGTLKDRAVNCLNAGVDAICYCAGIYQEMQAICAQKRFLTEKSLIRFAKIKKVIHNTKKDAAFKDIRRLYEQKLGAELQSEYSYDATETLHRMLKKEN